MKNSLNDNSNFIYKILLRIILRSYELFPKRDKPTGLVIFSLTIAVNFFTPFNLLYNLGIINEAIISISYVIALIIMVSIITFLYFKFIVKGNIDALLSKEIKKSGKQNLNWILITILYYTISWISLILVFTVEF